MAHLPRLVLILKLTWEGVAAAQVTPTNVDIASVAPQYHLYTTAEVEEVITRLP